jgi:hypothetical protein
MIRISDLANAAAWARASSPAPRADRADATQDPSAWFNGDTIGADVRLTGDLSPGARGLTVEQHASRVLAHLCGERDA